MSDARITFQLINDDISIGNTKELQTYWNEFARPFRNWIQINQRELVTRWFEYFSTI